MTIVKIDDPLCPLFCRPERKWLVSIHHTSSMATAKKFRTKNGYCHVLADRLVFTRRNLWGRLGDLAMEGKMSRLIVLFSVITLLVFYFAYYQFALGSTVWGLLFTAIGAYLVYAIIKAKNQSVHPIIDRSKISNVTFVKSIEGISPPLLEIRFRDPNGKKKKRIVSLKFGDEQQALVVLKLEGLMT